MIVTAMLFSGPALAQGLDLPIPSPRASVSQQIGTLTVEVDYSSPGKKERTIWGELVPYDEMWRTGANSATTFTTDGDLKLGGAEVPAGEYAVLTIPGEEAWTVVLSTDLGARPWSYDEKSDLVRFEVKPEEGPARERLTFVFSDTDDDSATLDLEWDGVRVAMPIEVDTVGRAKAAIGTYVGRSARQLANGARFLADNGELDAALELVNTSLAVEETWFATWAKAEILKKQGQAKDAYKTAKMAMKLGEKADNFFWEDRVKKAVDEWPKK